MGDEVGLDVAPSATIGPGVELQAPCRIGPDAVLSGPLSAGPGLRMEARALLGGPAQHRDGEHGGLVLGRDVSLHECCTVHRGSPAGDGTTALGDRVRVMAYAHVGHDARLGDDVTLANGAQLGGHVILGAGATIGARAALHQRVRVGEGALVAAGAFVSGDVLPWTVVAGDRAVARGANRVALRRGGWGSCAGRIERLLRELSPGRGRPRSVDAIEAAAIDRWGALEPPLRSLLAFARAERDRPLCPLARR